MGWVFLVVCVAFLGAAAVLTYPGRLNWQKYLRLKQEKRYIVITPRLFEHMLTTMGYDVSLYFPIELVYRVPEEIFIGRCHYIYIYGRNWGEHRRMVKMFQKWKAAREKASNEHRVAEHNVTLPELQKFKKRLRAIEEGERKRLEILRDQYLEIASGYRGGG